jgi:tight adherence protein C
VSAAGALAGLATLLACLGVRELLGTRAREWRGGRDWRTGGRTAAAALRLGIPTRVARAGLDHRLPFGAVLAAKLVSAAAGAAVGLGAAPAAPGRLSLLVAAGMPLAGFLLPDALLERRARLRNRRLLAALPDACDLLAVGAASGRSPAAGFAELARAGGGPLADELRVTLAELSCGMPQEAALCSLRARVPGGEMARLCTTIERSRRYGSPLAEQLRRQSSAMRRDQRRAVEERAARAAPKIQLVVALVLVPSVLLMIVAALVANADLLLGGF